MLLYIHFEMIQMNCIFFSDATKDYFIAFIKTNQIISL